MQKSDEFKKEEKKNGKKGFLKMISERLRQKDEREVRQRLKNTVGFLLTVAVSFLLGGSELFFGTFPVAVALAVSAKNILIPTLLGVILTLLVGDVPDFYGYVCLATLLVRILVTLVPAAFRGLNDEDEDDIGLEITLSPEEKSVIRIDNAVTERNKIGKSERIGKNYVAESFGRVFCEDMHIKMICSAIGGFICGLFTLIDGNFSFYSFCATVALTLGAPLAVLVLGGIFGEKRYRREWYILISVAFAMSGCVYSACEKQILGMPMAPFLAMLLTLYVASGKGIFAGSVIGILCGLVWSPVYIPLLAISAIIFCLISAVRRNAGVAAVCGLIVVWCYYIGGESGLVGVLPPMLLSLPIYMLADKYREMMNSPYRRPAELADGIYFAEAVTEKSKNEAVRERLSSLSEAFSSLSETIYKLSDRFRRPDVLGPKRIADTAFEKTCEGCRNKDMCWGAGYSDTLDAVSCVTSWIHTRGSCSLDDLPQKFKARCVRGDKLIDEVNSAVTEATERIIKSGKASFFAENYDDITAILEDALGSDSEEYECDIELGGKVFDYLYAEGLGIGGVVVYGKRCRHVVAKGVSLFEGLSAERISEIGRAVGELVGATLTDPVFEVGKDGTVMLMHSCPKIVSRCAHGRISRSGKRIDDALEDQSGQIPIDMFEEAEEPCGDMTDSFITDNSYFYALISDGMGTGDEAAYTSGVCAMFIEKMLSAGNRADITLRMLNNVIRSENMGCGSECSATVDLLELDLMSGVASFIKSGAAPTYIARQGTVYKISSRTMPVGIIKDADARITRFDTKKGDIIVMISDGCCHDSEDCPWLVEYLCSYMSKGKNTVSVGEELCERLKEEILREAEKNAPEGEERDDISVSVIVVG